MGYRSNEPRWGLELEGTRPIADFVDVCISYNPILFVDSDDLVSDSPSSNVNFVERNKFRFKQTLVFGTPLAQLSTEHAVIIFHRLVSIVRLLSIELTEVLGSFEPDPESWSSVNSIPIFKSELLSVFQIAALQTKDCN